jgi:16S rRNA (guanine966-N2)-methyltransferase
MTRIVAGLAGGRRLQVPPGSRTRPTSDRAREGLFSALTSLTDLTGARFLDLYAGTGAVGLEALSRGAASVLLVESDARTAPILRANVRALDLPGAEVRVERVERVVASPAPEPYDIVFADPPYSLDLDEVVVNLVTNGWIGDLVVVERSSRDGDFRWPEGLQALRARRYGEATLWYGRRS